MAIKKTTLLFSCFILCSLGTGFELAMGQTEQEGSPSPPSSSSNPLDFLKKIPGIFGGSKEPLLSTIKPGPYEKSPEALGDARDIANQRLESIGLADVPDLQVYANDVYTSIKALSGKTQIPGRVYFLADDALTAKSTADGNIFISLGWLRTIESSDELFAILAHETGPIILRHHDTNIWGKLQKQVQFIFAALSAADWKLANLSSKDTKIAPRNLAYIQRMQLLIELNDRVLNPAWSRGQEQEADKIAVDLLVKGNYSFHEGMKVFLEHNAAWEERQDDIREAQKKEAVALANKLAAANDVGKAIEVSLQSDLGHAFDQLARTHDSALKRLQDAVEYYQAHYQNYVVSSHENAYEKLTTSRPVKAVLGAYQEAFAAKAQIESSNNAAAIRSLQRLTDAKSPLKDQVFPNYWYYQALRQDGQSVAATKVLERTLSLKEPSWVVIAQLTLLEFQAGRKDAAAQVVKNGLGKFSDAPAALPKAISLYRRVGFVDQANALNVTCYSSHPEYRDECGRSMNSPLR